MIEFTK